jgi:hypothetical protein
MMDRLQHELWEMPVKDLGVYYNKHFLEGLCVLSVSVKE